MSDGGQPAFGDGGVYPPVLLQVAFIVEGGGIVDGLGRHGGGVARQSVADGCCHVLGVEVVEVESVLASYLGQAWMRAARTRSRRHPNLYMMIPKSRIPMHVYLQRMTLL